MVLLAGAWGALALHYCAPKPFAAALAALFAAVAIAAALALVFARRRRISLPAFAVCFAALAAWWGSIEPTGGRVWAPELAQMVHADITGDRVTLSNVRNFVWRSETDFTPAWETRSYDVSKLVSTDLIAVYWAGPRIAHTIVSFGFEDGRHLAFSIEVRHADGEAYETVSGLFKQFELIIIAVDERDVLGLRHVRKEEPYLFRLRVDPARARPLFLEYVKRASALRDRPRFYDTITSNCTTVIFSMVRAVGFDPPWNWRVLVSGYLPDLAYSEGLLDQNHTIEDLRRLGAVEPKYRDGLDEIAFSRVIREGVPAPR